MVKDIKEYFWSSYRVYAYGKEDGLTNRHEIYYAMGEERAIPKTEGIQRICPFQ